MSKLVQDIVLARQTAENEFIASCKSLQPAMSSFQEKHLRDGFIAGFYEAFKKLKDLNKLDRHMKKQAKAVDKPLNP